MLHALVGGFIGLVREHFGRRRDLEQGTAFGPHWYPLALVVLAMPQPGLAADSASCSCPHALTPNKEVTAIARPAPPGFCKLHLKELVPW